MRSEKIVVLKAGRADGQIRADSISSGFRLFSCPTRKCRTSEMYPVNFFELRTFHFYIHIKQFIGTFMTDL